MKNKIVHPLPISTLIVVFLLSININFVFAGVVGERLDQSINTNSSESSLVDDFYNIENVKDIKKDIIKDINSKFSENEVLVRFKGENKFRRLSISSNSKEDNVMDFISRLKKQENVLYAEPNYIAKTLIVPNDQYYQYQWNFDKQLEKIWDSNTGSGIVVAIIDTGVAYENYRDFPNRFYIAPDLEGTSFVKGYDFVENDKHPNDDNGHGTHVAGTVAQTTNNKIGVAGMAYGVSIMPIKVMNSRGSGSYADIADGIRFAADNGADVINLSLGSDSPSNALKESLKYAYEKGVTIVAAAGNDGNRGVIYPAAYDDYVIAVGATRLDEKRTSYSNYGSSIDIVAPGGDLSVDQDNDGYGDGILQQTIGRNTRDFGYFFYQGTSMASPHVAAAAALIKASGVANSPDEIRSVIQSTAKDLGTSGRDDKYGFGLIDIHKALNGNNNGPNNPDPTPEPEPDPEPQPEPEPEPEEPEYLFFDSFEEGFSNWTQDSQGDWRNRKQHSTDGKYSAEVDGRANDAVLVSEVIDVDNGGSIKVSFDWLIEKSFDSGEYVAFDVSINNSSWNELLILKGNVDDENKWHNESINLNNVNNIKLRFRAKISSGVEDAAVDNIVINYI